jgi:hypothetical protein
VGGLAAVPPGVKSRSGEVPGGGPGHSSATRSASAVPRVRMAFWSQVFACATQAVEAVQQGKRDAILGVKSVVDARWADHQDELVTFVDGGIGRVQIASQAPILLRVGSYTVRTDERACPSASASATT